MITQYEISKDHLKISNKNQNYTYNWNTIYQIKERPMYFIIYLRENFIEIIPKRCFKNRAELDMFVMIITTNIESSKLQLKDYKIDDSHFNQEIIDRPHEDNENKESRNNSEKPLEYFSYRLNKSMRLKVTLAQFFRGRYQKVAYCMSILLVGLYLSNIQDFGIMHLLAIGVLAISFVIAPFYGANHILKELKKADEGRGYNIAYNEDKLVIYSFTEWG